MNRILFSSMRTFITVLFLFSFVTFGLSNSGLPGNGNGEKKKLRIYPDPASTHIYVIGISIADYNFVAVNILGKETPLRTMNNTVNLDRLDYGVFQLKCIAKDGSQLHVASIRIIK